jgi:hypothetical protein
VKGVDEAKQINIAPSVGLHGRGARAL